MELAAKLARALNHPLRVAILQVMTGKRMTVSDLASELDAPHRYTSYHVGQLRRLGFLTEDGAEIRRGGIERVYVLDGDEVEQCLHEIDALW